MRPRERRGENGACGGSVARTASFGERGLRMSEHVEGKSKDTSVVGWLDLHFVQNSLREGLGNPELVLVEHEVLPANARGENYASVVYKCSAKDVSGKEYRVIIKTIPTNAVRQLFCNKAEIFRKEIDMYTVVFPDYEDMLLASGMKRFWAKYYYSSMDGSKDTIVLEDIKPHGFVMRERRLGLNADHLEVAMTALARYHACSIALRLRGPEAFERKVTSRFQELLFTPDNENMTYWLESCIKTGSKAIMDWEGDKYSRIADKIRECGPELQRKTWEDFRPKEGAVLNHGDFWVNNMMFKYATPEEAETGAGKPTEVVLLDFQIARYCSPVIDLFYLMVTSVTPETRKKHWRRLVEGVYMHSLWSDIERLGHRGDIRYGRNLSVIRHI
ncbi:hypothetical protein J437_LFUL017515 [Ladona fulva]|uniref:CHK kinase-like domain-containing protein n=1 Tax=Ladona fulva TaxID=123851 RepID=A0A8K0KPV5_LADFU|nr:hypothetical protein J437_LFUL017515 [Ladona fulva]